MCIETKRSLKCTFDEALQNDKGCEEIYLAVNNHVAVNLAGEAESAKVYSLSGAEIRR